MLYALINRHWRPISRKEFWHEMGEEETSLALAFVPEEQRGLIYEKDRKAFEVY